MRTLMLFSLLVVAAACADDQHPTSPVRAASPTVARPAMQGDKTSDSSPNASSKTVGFTQATQYFGNWISVHALDGGGKVAHVACPVGTTPISGDYEIVGFNPAAPPFISRSWAVGDGWSVVVYNGVVASTDLTARATAICAS